VETRCNPTPDRSAAVSGAQTPPLHADGLVLVPHAAAPLDPSVFSKVNPSEAIPASWEDRARKAWEYYLEEPLLKNCANSWRTFALGAESKIAGDDEKVKWEAVDVADRLSVFEFVKDMILQLLVKGDAVGFNRMLWDYQRGYPHDSEFERRMGPRLRNDRDLGHWMDEQRQEAIDAMNRMLDELGHQPLRGMTPR